MEAAMMRKVVALAVVATLAACLHHQGAPCPFDGDACHRSVYTNDSAVVPTCDNSVVDDGQPCRTGVGICTNGVCANPPGTPASCGAVVFEAHLDVCNTREECFVENPCVEYACRNPGIDSCTYDAKVDGTRCAQNTVCLHGECCLDKQDAACSVNDDCVPIEACTVGECVGSQCVFTRSAVDDSCVTSDNHAGRCAVQSMGDVPRCLPVP